jgi:hypothetical protein
MLGWIAWVFRLLLLVLAVLIAFYCNCGPARFASAFAAWALPEVYLAVLVIRKYVLGQACWTCLDRLHLPFSLTAPLPDKHRENR